MLRALRLLSAPYQGIAPIVARPTPLSLGLAKLGRALKQTWASCTQDVFDPGRHQEPLPLPRDLPVAGHWSDREQRYVVEALVLPFDSSKLFDGFAQSEQGNCALVATMKGAMKKFGNRLFSEVGMGRGGRWHVGLRDGASVSVGREELAMTKEKAKLRGPDSPLMSYAVLAYAVAAARRAQLTPAVDFQVGLVDGWLEPLERFERALDSLGDGHSVRDCATYLGVGHEVRTRVLRPGEQIFDDSTVVSSGSHATFVGRQDGEARADHYGEAVEYDGTDTNGRPVIRRVNFEGPGLQQEDGWFYI